MILEGFRIWIFRRTGDGFNYANMDPEQTPGSDRIRIRTPACKSRYINEESTTTAVVFTVTNIIKLFVSFTDNFTVSAPALNMIWFYLHWFIYCVAKKSFLFLYTDFLNKKKNKSPWTCSICSLNFGS